MISHLVNVDPLVRYYRRVARRYLVLAVISVACLLGAFGYAYVELP